jgi:hypothetical protein
MICATQVHHNLRGADPAHLTARQASRPFTIAAPSAATKKLLLSSRMFFVRRFTTWHYETSISLDNTVTSRAIFQSLRAMGHARNSQRHSLKLDDCSWWCLIFTSTGSTSAAANFAMGMLVFENRSPCYGNIIPLLRF